MRLNQIPGFADVKDTNFAAESYAVGFNFQRVLENAKLGVVRPEMFVGSYIHGDTVALPVSPMDGYTYQRDELCYLWNVVLSGSTAANSGSTPSASGALRFVGQLVDADSGKVYSYMNYQTGDGSSNTTTNDGTLEVYTLAMRRKNSLIVTTNTGYSAIADSELQVDSAVTESIAQRMNRNAKAAALSCEVVYMGEYTNGQQLPLPVSQADGYAYSLAEVTYAFSWRWTTQIDQFITPPYPPYKQLNDIQASITNGVVSINVTYYDNGPVTSPHGRISVVAICKRAVQLGAGSTDFVDITSNLLVSGLPLRSDVLLQQAANTRYALCRHEVFQGVYTNGQTVALPVSPIDGYTYSRHELNYIYTYASTSPQTNIRLGVWKCQVDQSTGVVTSIIQRVADGGTFKQTNDGQLMVWVFAQRDDVVNPSYDYPFTGGGSGGNEVQSNASAAFLPPIPFQVTATTFTPNLNFTALLDDGSSVQIADGQPTTTGLTASTPYKWYPLIGRNDRQFGQVQTGGVGTPPNLQTAATRALYAEWNNLNNIPLAASPIDVVTTATGAPPSGGSGGGDNGCLRGDMLVFTKEDGPVRCDQLLEGSHVLGANGKWALVRAVNKALHRSWAHVRFNHGGSLVCTTGHPFVDADSNVMIRAYDLTLRTLLPWQHGVCSPVEIKLVNEVATKVRISVSAPHLFLAGATAAKLTLTHNLRPNDGDTT